MKTKKSVLITLIITAILFFNGGWSSTSASSVKSQIQSSILYVKPAVTGTTCSSWADPCTLQAALDIATDGDQIWVVEGTYNPSVPAGREATFQLISGVAIYGGFIGNETNLSERDWETNVTTLSGDIGSEGDDTDNSYHVVTGSGTDATAILDGFTITEGNADGTFTSGFDNGGGMFIDSGSPTINNAIFVSNSAVIFGGGLYNYYSSPALSHVTFVSNSVSNANGFGGGMVNYFSHPSLTDVTFINNSGNYGAGLHNWYSNPSLTDVTFSGNLAASRGGGMHNDNSSPTLTNVTFNENTSYYGGSGMVNWNNSNSTLTNVLFSGNTATGDFGSGGGMSNVYSSPNLTNVTFSGNSVLYNGGGMVNDDSSPTMTNVTFIGNSAGNGGGMANLYSSTKPVMTNSILWGNTPDQIFNQPLSTVTITYSDVQGGWAGTGNINADPLLGPLADNGGFSFTHALGAGSSAIDAGDPSNCPATDQRGVIRPIDGDGVDGPRCDMGAYEYEVMQVDFPIYLPMIVR